MSGGSKLTKVTDGAVSFDGTNDYLEVADSADFTFGSDDWTMECFVYPRTPGSNSYQSLIHKYDGSSASGSSWFWSLYSYTDGSSSMNFYFYSGSSQYAYTAASKVVRHNTWNHIVATKDGNTVRLYVNGVQDGTIDVTGYTMNDSSTSVRFGTDGAGAYDMSGFISNARIIKGTCLYTNGTAFTPPTRELTNVTNTKLLCCQSNTSATEGAVKPGSITANGDAAATNFNPFNTDINTVRGQETGYATLNPLKVNSSSSIVLSDGNLRVDITGNYYNAVSTLGMSSGKFYCEISPLRGYSYLGIATGDVVNNTWGGDQTNNTAWVLHTNGSIYHNNATTNGTGFPTPGTSGGYVLGLLFDADNKTMRYVDNGMISNIYNMANTVDGDLFYFFVGGDAGSYEIDVNFGQKPFKFPPPDGFQPLNAANVKPVKVFARPDQFVGVTTYTGNGGTQSIDVGLKPDLVWLKASSEADWHLLMDTVRSNTSAIFSNSTQAQETLNGTTQLITSFNRDGFTVVQDNTNFPGTSHNQNSQSLVAWAWKAGGDKNTFNVDDVGYASASDVNMGVGAQNSAVYNTSAIWSGMMSGPSNSGSYTSLFDGTDGDAGGYEQPTDGNTLTFTPTGGITATSSIEIYAYQSASTYAGSADITVNGSSIKTGAVQSALGTGAAGGYVNIGTTSLTTLTWSNPSGSNNDYRLMAIKVDGKILVDSNQTPPNVPSIAATGASVGTKQGFSIIKYTGTGTAGTIPHGLLEQPKFVIIKDLKNGNAWAIQHVGTTLGTGLLKFNTDDVDNTVAAAVWNSTAPTSSVFSVGTSTDTNGTTNSAEYITYLWHDVPGLQKFGIYEGNADADGTFVELGFRPILLWRKGIDNNSRGWYITDAIRDASNPVNTFLDASDADADGSGTAVDFLSNGFKLRNADAGTNYSETYIYCAWAEAPTFNLYGAQSNAR